MSSKKKPTSHQACGTTSEKCNSTLAEPTASGGRASTALPPIGACLGKTEIFIWKLPVLSWRTNHISVPGFVLSHCSAAKNHKTDFDSEKDFSFRRDN